MDARALQQGEEGDQHKNLQLHPNTQLLGQCVTSQDGEQSTQNWLGKTVTSAYTHVVSQMRDGTQTILRHRLNPIKLDGVGPALELPPEISNLPYFYPNTSSSIRFFGEISTFTPFWYVIAQL